MQKETVSIHQAVCIIVLFIFGSTVVVGVSAEAGQDTWISLLLAVLMMVPLIIIYGRIIRLFPETDLFDILEILFGKILGKILIAFIAWYALHLCSLVLRNFSEFLKIVMMPETPELPLMIAMILLTCYLSRSGVATLGKWSVTMFPIVTITILLTVLLSSMDMDFKNLQPVLEKEPAVLVRSAYQTLTFPFAETILFLCMASSFRRQNSSYKIYGYAVAISSFFLLAVMIRNITVLGSAMVDASYFPSYTTARILHIGDFLSRIEGSITMNFLLSGIVKITVCLSAATKGIAKLFSIENHKQLVYPVGLLILALCAIIYKSAIEMFGFIKYYQIYAIPFQLLIPAVVWITAEIRAKKRMAA